jgi:hypothetical protein
MFLVIVQAVSLTAVYWFQKKNTNWVTQKGKRSETKISNIMLYYCGFRQERYSKTVLSEAHYSGGYLYFIILLNCIPQTSTFDGEYIYAKLKFLL